MSSNVTNLVICPALRKQEENTYSLDDGHELIKTVVTKYDYDYSSNNTYTNAYGCTKTTQTVTGYENGINKLHLFDLEGTDERLVKKEGKKAAGGKK